MGRKKPRHIAVLTFWETTENYGQVLQAYALQRYLVARGHDSYLVRYRVALGSKRGWYWHLRHWAGRAIRTGRRLFALRSLGHRASDTGWQSFGAKRIVYSKRIYRSLLELRLLPPKADVYIVGSDQVWNFNFNGESDVFLLRFGSRKILRLSFAASFGHAALPERLKTRYRDGLARFAGVSARERSGVTLCEELGVRAALVPDPTLLLPVAIWNDIIGSAAAERDQNRTRVFAYVLGNRSGISGADVRRVFDERADVDLALCTINKDESGDIKPAVEGWLDEIRNADVVVTNSFHGTVFSILFQRRFVAIGAGGSTQGMDGRMLTLLGDLGLSGHFVKDFNLAAFESVGRLEPDWSEVACRLQICRQQADEFCNAHGL